MRIPRQPATAARRELLADSLGVGVATGAYGVSFGAIAVTSGFDVVQACALSLLVFTGASQFALVGVVASGGSPLSGAATALMLGSRNTLYGLTLASLLRLRGIRRLVGAQLVIDESTAMALKPKDARDAPLGFFATGLSVFVLWNLSTLLGALAGDAMGDPTTYGLDAAVPAAFLALLWPRLYDFRTRVTAAAAALLALALVPATRPGIPVIAAAGVAVLSALLVRRTGVPPGQQEDAESVPTKYAPGSENAGEVGR
ncbi:MAG: AzlC family ABC transporter permease [Propionibacteriales bacterium]|nr:AzlC family ABC transporter permease [Propionibacteriales bacterium]